jgi:hypothetical protein
VIFYPDETAGRRPGVYVPIEPADPFTEAIRTGLEIGAEIVFADPDAGQRPHLKDAYPDPYAIRHIGLARYIEAYRVYPQPRSEESRAARRRHRLETAGRRSRWPASWWWSRSTCSTRCWTPWRSRRRSPWPARAARASSFSTRTPNRWPKSARIPRSSMALRDLPRLMTDGNLIDRRHAQLAVFRAAEKEYEANTGERIAHWQRRLLARYTRNLALAANDLSAGLFDLTVAARAVADDNYAWEVWEAAGRYPPRSAIESDLPTVRISGEEVWIDTRRIRLRRRLPNTKQRLRPYGLKPRKKEKFPGEWASQLNGAGICSYPPEDLIIEDYGRLPQEEGQEHPLRGARARRAVHHLDSGRHRPARDHPQVVRRPHLRAPVPEDSRRGGQRGGDLR